MTVKKSEKEKKRKEKKCVFHMVWADQLMSLKRKEYIAGKY